MDKSMIERCFKILDAEGWLSRLKDIYECNELGQETIEGMLARYPRAMREEYRQQFWDACMHLWENREKSIPMKTEAPQANEFKVGDFVYYIPGNDEAIAEILEFLPGRKAARLKEGPATFLCDVVNFRLVEDAIAVKAEIVSSKTEIVSSNGLSDIEITALKYAEDQIEKGLQSFIEIGAALKQIQENKLYRAQYLTFEAYLESRWGMSREQGYRNISAATVAKNLLPIGNIPTAESQVRLLSPLSEDEQRQVWADAVKRTPAGTPTAATVASVLAERGLKVPKSALPKGTFTEEGRDSDELYTPPDFLESVYKCLGEIDLDPCSNSLTNPNVKAKSHYTKELDGLAPSRVWAGTVYMNCPYSKPGPWVNRLHEGFSYVDVDKAIALLPCDPSTAWWEVLTEYPVCLLNKRLKFIGATGSARFASAAFYLGADLRAFYAAFSEWGEVRQSILM